MLRGCPFHLMLALASSSNDMSIFKSLMFFLSLSISIMGGVGNKADFVSVKVVEVIFNVVFKSPQSCITLAKLLLFLFLSEIGLSKLLILEIFVFCTLDRQCCKFEG